MNKKQWTGLLMVYVSYLFLGATVFYFIESQAEMEDRDSKFQEYFNLTRFISERIPPDDLILVLEKLESYCDKPFLLDRTKDDVVPEVWDFYNAFFFVVTVVSTIGYGNLHPTTDPGRILMIFYAIIGIPLNGILLSSLGQFFGAVFIRAHRKYKSRNRFGARCGLFVNILTYLAPGLIVFIFLPAGLFCYFEDWDYAESVYYAFVTLTTIGFGDLVAGQKTISRDNHSSGALIAYKIALISWVIFGLGYLIMLLGFVAQAMQNKKIVRLEEKLVFGLTHNKLWNGFAKDIGYLRRILNEMSLEKVKPIFKDPKEELPQKIVRSKSLPDLLPFSEEEAMRMRRQRAMSEHIPKKSLVRVFSETDLQRIDINATFAAATAVPTTFELMRRVIDVYSGAQMRSDWNNENEEKKGVDGFSDEEVLSSETWSERRPSTTHTIMSSRHPSSIFNLPSYEDTVSRQPHRGRAMSECPPPELNQVNTSPDPDVPVDWTWSGPNANKLHDIIKQRTKQRMLMGLNKGRKGSIANTVAEGARKLNPLRHRRRCVTENPSTESLDNNVPQIDRPKHHISVPEDIGRKRGSLQDIKVPYFHQEPQYMTTTTPSDLHKIYSRGDHVFSGPSTGRDTLQEPSLMDFLQVLTDLHTRVGERLVAAENQTKPKRKMGTASLTPPRIRSLLELFPTPTVQNSPKQAKRAKPPKRTHIFRTDSKRDVVVNVDSNGGDGEKLPEPSNLKRLGRFLLRSYSTTQKDTEDLSKFPFKRKRFSLWPTEGEERDKPPFQLHVDSPSEGSQASTDIAITIDHDEGPSGSNLDTRVLSPGLLFPPSYTSTVYDDASTPRTSTSSRKHSGPFWAFDNPAMDPKDKSE